MYCCATHGATASDKWGEKSFEELGDGGRGPTLKAKSMLRVYCVSAEAEKAQAGARAFFPARQKPMAVKPSVMGSDGAEENKAARFEQAGPRNLSSPAQ